MLRADGRQGDRHVKLSIESPVGTKGYLLYVEYQDPEWVADNWFPNLESTLSYAQEEFGVSEAEWQKDAD